MRRRNHHHESARNFYKQHKHVESVDDYDIINDDTAEDRRGSNNNDKPLGNNQKEFRKAPVSSRIIILLRARISILIQFISATWAIISEPLRIFSIRKGMDATDDCPACSHRFSYQRRRRKCRNCFNEFCDNCLKREHEIFDGKPGSAGTKESVCVYCFFTLCARHCRATCCIELSAKELKQFLKRKGVSSKTAIEKSDLVDLIHQWSLDLDTEAARCQRQEKDGQGSIEDLEAGGGGQEETIRRKQTSYSATSAHLFMNEMDSGTSCIGINTYSTLGIRELRHILINRSIDTSDCIEKTELVKLLVQSDNGTI
mmetsp:Transcript_20225/g.40326  ORF Transcript_20225/g.40326 Transcript_20225/m.40326 type:complete len:314 (-) Transcript_20225:667-1608(-)